MSEVDDARPTPGSDAPAPDGARGPDGGEHLVPERVSLSPVLEVSQRPNPFQRVKHLWQYRELLVNLTRKELKVKYKNSVLGFVWSLLNPLLYLVVFGIVFGVILGSQIHDYAIFMLSGLLAWNFFSASLGGGTAAIVGNATLVTKVWFPRETLVLASVGAALVHFFLQSLVLGTAMLVVGRVPSLHYLPALPFAMLDLLILASALAIALAAVNVYLRDTQHLLELVLLAWFWVSAIVYPYWTIVAKLGAGREWLASVNPFLPIAVTFQRVLYNPTKSEQFHLFPGNKQKTLDFENSHRVLPDHPLSWFLSHLAVVGIGSLVLLYLSLVLFTRLEDNFAEEI
ncbi:MAG: type transporter [Acidimicrobiales bacterium]|nr:type transporter [Acidimicrobiales bacterium]